MQKIGQAGAENTQATDPGVNFDQVAYGALQEDGVLPSVMIPLCIYQNRLETNNYTSNVFLQNNNLNGYNFVPPNGSSWQSGPGLSKPASEGGGYYGAYSSIENSAHEQSYWWARRSTQDGLDLTTIVDIDSFVQALATYQWFQSPPSAYALRMKAVSALVNLEQTTGLNTQGTSNTTILAVLGGIVGVGVLLLSKS